MSSLIHNFRIPKVSQQHQQLRIRLMVGCIRHLPAEQKRSDPFTLVGVGVVPPAVLCPVLGPPVQHRHERAGESKEGPPRW